MPIAPGSERSSRTATPFQCCLPPAAAEGKVWQKFDCEVARKTPAGGAGAGGKVRGGSSGQQERQLQGWLAATMLMCSTTLAHSAGLTAPSPCLQVVLDPEYRKLSRQRHQAAAAKTRTVQYLQDTKLVGAPTTVQVRDSGVCRDDCSTRGAGGSRICTPSQSLSLWPTAGSHPTNLRRLARSARRCRRSATAWMHAS